MSHIDFLLGSAVLASPERDKLVWLLKPWKEKEKLELDVPITYVPDLYNVLGDCVSRTLDSSRPRKNRPAAANTARATYRECPHNPRPHRRRDRSRLAINTPRSALTALHRPYLPLWMHRRRIICAERHRRSATSRPLRCIAPSWGSMSLPDAAHAIESTSKKKDEQLRRPFGAANAALKPRWCRRNPFQNTVEILENTRRIEESAGGE